MSNKIKISIIGAGGYTGEELLRLLASHPKVQVVEAVGRSIAGKTVGEVFADLKDGYNDLKFTSETDYSAELYFTCLPHGESMDIVSDLIAKDKKVIDLSADFRISDKDTYEKWYVPHSCPDLIAHAVYGLPEINSHSYNEKIKQTNLVANPGCYPTGALLALAPMADAIEPSVIIDSKSGTSGAGKAMEEELNDFTDGGGFKAYKIGAHRHSPEIKQGLDLVSSRDSRDSDSFKVIFTPHLLPVFRGILTTAYATLKEKSSTKDLIEKYNTYYKDKPFVSILAVGDFPNISDVVMTNNCQIGIYVNPDNGVDVTVVSAIDNLVKGASGEAIQNMNLMYGFDEDSGLKD